MALALHTDVEGENVLCSVGFFSSGDIHVLFQAWQSFFKKMKKRPHTAIILSILQTKTVMRLSFNADLFSFFS